MKNIYCSLVSWNISQTWTVQTLMVVIYKCAYFMSILIHFENISQNLAVIYFTEVKYSRFKVSKSQFAKYIIILLVKTVCFQDQLLHVMNWVWIDSWVQTIDIDTRNIYGREFIGIFEYQIQKIWIIVARNIYFFQVEHLCHQQSL